MTTQSRTFVCPKLHHLASLAASRLWWLNLNHYKKRPVQDCAMTFSTPGMEESGLYCVNHGASRKFQQSPHGDTQSTELSAGPCSSHLCFSMQSDKRKGPGFPHLRHTSLARDVSQETLRNGLIGWGSTRNSLALADVEDVWETVRSGLLQEHISN